MNLVIGVCDDNRSGLDSMSGLLQSYCEKNKIEMELRVFDSGKLYMDTWQENKNIDILLLDIEMPEVDGIQLKEFLQNNRSKTKILFISSHVEAVWEAFGENVYGFIKKPLNEEILFGYLDKVIKTLEYEKKPLHIDNKSGNKIMLDDILWIKSEGQYSIMQLKDGDLFSNLSLAEWESELDKNIFSRVHRSYIVNFKHVNKVDDVVKIDTGVTVPIARRRKSAIKDAYKDFLIHEV